MLDKYYSYYGITNLRHNVSQMWAGAVRFCVVTSFIFIVFITQ